MLLAVIAGAAGCKEVGPGEQGTCWEGEMRCEAESWQTCVGGEWTETMVCAEPAPYCASSIGCYGCEPGLRVCDGDRVVVCGADGQPESLEECDAALQEHCYDGACVSACEQAALSSSYQGCEYWPTPTSNPSLDFGFWQNFGVLVHNPNDVAVHAEIWRRDEYGNPEEHLIAEQTIVAGEMHTFELTIDTGLTKAGLAGQTSVIAGGGAYRLTTTLPVPAYQFNPLDYVKYFTSPEGQELRSYSQTNDAALLLPTHALGERYRVMSRQTFGVEGLAVVGTMVFAPGLVAVVATENDTEVTVRSSCHTQQVVDHLGQTTPGLTPGGQETFTLQAGQVLQLLTRLPEDCSEGTLVVEPCGDEPVATECQYCDMGRHYDLTGTEIESTAPVAVFGGHACSFVPFNAWACDHLVEQLLPLQAWGTDYLVTRTVPQTPGTPEPNLIRVLSGTDGNVITFDPPLTAVGDSTTLDAGQWVEFEARQDVHVLGSGALMVGQYLVGQNYSDFSVDIQGDPSFAVMVPTAQFRRAYSFLAPASFPSNYVNVIKPVGEQAAAVYLDGEPLAEELFSAPIGDTGYGVAAIPIEGTHHSVRSAAPFGIVVYGFASYTSYMYPGGLDLRPINPVL